MSAIKSSTDLAARPHVVGTVHSPGSLRRAISLKEGAVDFLELRVDQFAGDLEPLTRALRRLKFPLIVTVRHPAEGGANGLGFSRRRELFERFLPHATFIDVELRSLEALASTVEEARRGSVGVIASDHHFRRTPSVKQLAAIRQRFHSSGADIFKLAGLTTTPADVARLLAIFTHRSSRPLSVMGMGAFGKISRLLFAQAGSVLNYGYLDQPNAAGQWEATLLRKRLSELLST